MLLPRQQRHRMVRAGASACRPRGARRTRPCGAPRPWHGRRRTATGRSRSPRGHAVRAPAHGGPRHRGGRAAARGGGAPAPARRSQPRRGWPRAGSPLARTAGPAGRKMTRTTRKASWIPHHDVDTAHAGPGAVCRAASDAFRLVLTHGRRPARGQSRTGRGNPESRPAGTAGVIPVLSLREAHRADQAERRCRLAVFGRPRGSHSAGASLGNRRQLADRTGRAAGGRRDVTSQKNWCACSGMGG